MPVESMLIAAAVVAVFAIFMALIVYADRTAGGR